MSHSLFFLMSLRLGERNHSSRGRSAFCGSRCALVMGTGPPWGLWLCDGKAFITLHKYPDARLCSLLPEHTPRQGPLTRGVVISLLHLWALRKATLSLSCLYLLSTKNSAQPTEAWHSAFVEGMNEWMNYKDRRKLREGFQTWTSRKQRQVYALQGIV